MRGLKFPPRKRVEPVEIPDMQEGDDGADAHLAAMYREIDCRCIELVTITPEISLVVDEEFLLHDDPAWNRAFAAGPGMVHQGHCFNIGGVALAFHNDRSTGNLCSLTVAQAELMLSLVKGSLTSISTTDDVISLLQATDDMHWRPTPEQLHAWLVEGVRW